MPALTPYCFDVRRFDKMLADDMFGDRKVELLNGLPILRSSCPGHDYAVAVTTDALRDRLERARWTVREEKHVVLSNRWKPMPDAAVVRGPNSNYARRTPGVADIALLVEVSDTTYAKDSGFKRRCYARFGIPAYWIVHINRRVVEVYAPGPEGLDLAGTYTEHEDVPLSLDGKDLGAVPAAGLFP
jgi:Uma2 family endonuclease